MPTGSASQNEQTLFRVSARVRRAAEDCRMQSARTVKRAQLPKRLAVSRNAVGTVRLSTPLLQQRAMWLRV